MKKTLLHFVLMLMLVSAGLSSCDIIDPWDPPGNGGGNGGGGNHEEIYQGTGTILYITNMEGTSFWGIMGHDGRNFEPVNLAQQFQVDGLTVSFKGKVLKDYASFNYFGEGLEVLEMEAIEFGNDGGRP